MEEYDLMLRIDLVNQREDTEESISFERKRRLSVRPVIGDTFHLVNSHEAEVTEVIFSENREVPDIELRLEVETRHAYNQLVEYLKHDSEWTPFAGL